MDPNPTEQLVADHLKVGHSVAREILNRIPGWESMGWEGLMYEAELVARDIGTSPLRRHNMADETETKVTILGPSFPDEKGGEVRLTDALVRAVKRFDKKSPYRFRLESFKASLRELKEALTQPGELFGPPIQEEPKVKKGDQLTIKVCMGKTDKGRVVTGMYVDWFTRTKMAKVYVEEEHRSFTGKVVQD